MAALGLIGMLTVWGVVGVLPVWLSLVLTRGRSIVALPLATFGGLAGGALVPAFGAKDFTGLGISLLAAFVAGVVAVAVSMRIQPKLTDVRTE